MRRRPAPASRFREDTHFYATRGAAGAAPTRCWRRAAGWPTPACCASADDVLHLRLEELEDLADPATLPPADAERLRGLVTQTRGAGAPSWPACR